MPIDVQQISSLPDDIDELRNASVEEGFGHIERLCRDFESGENLFDRPGEALFAARDVGLLVGVAGLNCDPLGRADVGRVRRMYVLPEWRRRGVGRCLLEAIESAAAQSFKRLTLYTGTDRGSSFYASLGYSAVADERVSHIKRLD